MVIILWINKYYWKLVKGVDFRKKILFLREVLMWNKKVMDVGLCMYLYWL